LKNAFNTGWVGGHEGDTVAKQQTKQAQEEVKKLERQVSELSERAKHLEAQVTHLPLHLVPGWLQGNWLNLRAGGGFEG
jgi:hypothetical protein